MMIHSIDCKNGIKSFPMYEIFNVQSRDLGNGLQKLTIDSKSRHD